MRTLLVAILAAGALIAVSGCGSSSKSGAQARLQRDADLYQIDQIEKNFHRAASTHDIDLMMCLWAPNATFNIDRADVHRDGGDPDGSVGRGRRSSPQNHWVSDTPAYKIRTTVNGDQGTLYFECHYVDTKTGKVRRHRRRPGRREDQRRWKITEAVAASSPTLTSHP